MEIDESSSEDEVFFGEVTQREMNHPMFNSRRRTTVFFPGSSRPDSSVSVLKELTEDGTLKFSCEKMGESCKEHSAVNKSYDVPEGSKSDLASVEMEQGKSAEREEEAECKRSQGWSSDDIKFVDSGFSSADGSLSVTAVASLSSLTSSESEIENFFPSAEAYRSVLRQCWSESSKTESVQSQSPVTPEDSPAEVSAMVKDFPACHADRGFTSPAVGKQRFLPLKRKLVPRSPSDQLEPNLKSNRKSKGDHSGSFRTEPGNHSPVSSSSNHDDIFTPVLESFDYINMVCARRKLQRLDLSYEQSPKAGKHSPKVSAVERRVFAGGEAHITPKLWSVSRFSAPPFDPAAPDTKAPWSAFCLSNGNLAGQDENDSEIVPSSQWTETDVSPLLSMGISNSSTVRPIGNNVSVDSFETLSHPSSAIMHSVSEGLKTPLSPDLFSSECPEEPFPPAASTPNPVYSPMPGSAVSSVSKLESPMQSLRLAGVEEGLSKKLKYGGLVMRKPIKTSRRRGNKENSDNGPFPGLPNSLPSFTQLFQLTTPTSPSNTGHPSDAESPCAEDQLEEDSRAVMTHKNTMINGETRHSLHDHGSSSTSSFLSRYPPPKQATRVSWSDSLEEEPAGRQSPAQSPAAPRSILQQRPDSCDFPFSNDPPSPIDLTRRRFPKLVRLLSFDN